MIEVAIDAGFFSMLIILFSIIFLFLVLQRYKIRLLLSLSFFNFFNQLSISGWLNYIFDIESQFIRSDFVVTSVYGQALVSFLDLRFP